MKKLYTLLSLLLLCVAGAQAQITAVSEITADGVYTIQATDTDRGYLAYNTADGVHLWSTGCSGYTSSDKANYWHIISTGTEGSYTLKNAISGTYITGTSNPWTLTSTAGTYTIEAGTSSGFVIKSTENHLINISNGWAYGTNCLWDSQDGGNTFIITKVADCEKISVTYKVTINGEERSATVDSYTGDAPVLPESIKEEGYTYATETTELTSSTTEITYTATAINYLPTFQSAYSASYGTDAALTTGTGLFQYNAEKYAAAKETYSTICAKYASTSMALSDYTADCATMDAAIAAIPNYPATGYFRLKNYKYNTYAGVGTNTWSNSVTGLKGGISADIKSTDISTVFQLVAISGETNKYYLNVEGKGVATQAKLNNAFPATADENAGTTFSFEIVDPSTGVVRIKDNNNNDTQYYYLHCAGWDAPAIVKWEDGEATRWYVEEVSADENLALTLNACDDNSYYATLNLPFGATISGAKAYTAAYTTDGSAISLTELADGVVAANTPVVLVGSSESATATVNADAADPNATNILTGTNFSITSWDATNLALGQVDGKPGFYLWSGSSLSANKAYLVPSTESAGLAFNFDGTTTAIQSAISEAANATSGAIFDLSGRRVTKATKGFYIIGGKKVIK